MWKLSLVMMVMLVATSWGQLSAPTAPAAPAGPLGPGSNAPARVVRHGGSMFRASLAAQAQAGEKPAVTNYCAVAAPEPKSIKRHDFVTIVVREESSFSSQGTTDLKKQADIDAKIESYMKLSLSKLQVQPGSTAASGPLAMAVNGTRDFKGEGTVDRTDSLTLRVTAEVVDVKPNGTLVLQAQTHIKTDDEEQFVTLTGNCRVTDVTPDNTVLSWQLQNLELVKNHKGALKDTTNRGLMSKILDFINPF